MMKPLSLYIHVPFCARKCAYCDFASWSGIEDQWEVYFHALWKEMDAWRETLSGREIVSVFFGGGTPTLVPAEYIAETLARIGGTAPNAEITLEGNPGTLSREKLSVYRVAGVNRLSLGAQSFDDALLKVLGRIHSSAQIDEAVAMARLAGFENLNLDLMYGLPGQTEERWQESLKRALALDTPHISAYSLIVEEGTPLCADVAAGRLVLPDEDAVVRMQRLATAMLADAGLPRYEISNYARPGFECRHNLVYWRRGDYLGLGCAAHSFLDGRRFENPASLQKYLAGERQRNEILLTDEDEAEEMLMLSTRTVQGFDLMEYRARFQRDFEKEHEAAIARLKASGLIRIEGGTLRLTERGMEVQNAVLVELLEDGANG